MIKASKYTMEELFGAKIKEKSVAQRILKE